MLPQHYPLFMHALADHEGVRGEQKPSSCSKFVAFFFFVHHLNPRQGMSFINVSHPHMKGVAIIRVTDCVYKALCI